MHSQFKNLYRSWRCCQLKVQVSKYCIVHHNSSKHKRHKNIEKIAFKIMAPVYSVRSKQKQSHLISVFYIFVAFMFWAVVMDKTVFWNLNL